MKETKIETCLKNWTRIREEIFQYEGIPTLDMWNKLSIAEHALMKEGRELLEDEKIDCSDIPELDEEWFKRAKLTKPGERLL